MRISIFLTTGKTLMSQKKLDADYILWERQLPFRPYSDLDEDRIFIFDYEAEGDRDKLIETSEAWNVQIPRYLLLFPDRKHDDTGCLPLPPPNRLQKHYLFSPKKLKDRKHDMFFMCAPTYIHISNSELKEKQELPFFSEIPERKEFVYNQRLEWIQQLLQGNLLREGNGLIHSKHKYLSQKIISNQFGYKGEVFVPPISKREFTDNLISSKIIFSPGGHSRWAYRHVESLYNRALTITVDMSDRKSIPSLPYDAFVMVPDGKFDFKEIKRILEQIETFQEKADIGYEFARSTYKERTVFHKEGFRQEKVREMFIEFMEWVDSKTK